MNKDRIIASLKSIKACIESGANGAIADTVWLTDYATVVDELDYWIRTLEPVPLPPQTPEEIEAALDKFAEEGTKAWGDVDARELRSRMTERNYLHALADYWGLDREKFEQGLICFRRAFEAAERAEKGGAECQE